ncbi:uncharacterized protein LOC144180423 isoform X1 [Haemaphysalis longicornis]
MELPLQLRFLLLVQAVLVSSCCAEMRDEDRKIIVRLHNQLRNSVAMGRVGKLPQAADMQQLEYSQRLEELAFTPPTAYSRLGAKAVTSENTIDPARTCSPSQVPPIGPVPWTCGERSPLRSANSPRSDRTNPSQ